MNTTTTSLVPSSPEQIEVRIRCVERLLDGPNPAESWPSPADAYELLQALSEIQKMFRKRQMELLQEGLLGNGNKVRHELDGISILLWQARCRNLELLYGGRVEWERLEQLNPLNWRDRDYFESYFKCHCTEPRRTLLEWANRGQPIGRFVCNDWHAHPEVWKMINLVATGQLTESTVRAAYGRLFEVFPVLSCPPKAPGSCSSRECIIGNLSAKPVYAIWELQQIAEALGIGKRKRL